MAAVGLICALQTLGEIEEEDLTNLGDQNAVPFSCDQVLTLSPLLFQTLNSGVGPRG